MNKAKLKSYAPQARKDFIAAVEARAHSLGLSEMGGTLDIAPGEKKGDVALIAGQAWPAKVHDQRQRLIKRMKKDGFAQTVEAVAYTWFNRFAALRYMEIHDYLDHGYRVLSSREGGLPEIIAHATDVAGNLPGLNASQIAEMKLAGNQDGELYRLLLVAQCNALSKAMPFLFEHIDDESELLLPGNLERTDSVVAKLVESIAEEDWNEVEVIGWLYQFYISEKKDAVIGKVVKSEDIPAATQLFTPNWIVQYLVQNSVGRLWLMANPSSTLKSQWKYYIEPAEQTPEVQAQLDALIQTRMAEDGGSLNPETITVLDPACGSGHILVEAYEVLKAIYLERGYQARAIPRLILEKNLFGLDIDDRAAQMAGFALMMKARADDRRLLDSTIKLNVLSLQESRELELDEFDSHLKPFGISRALLASLIDTFAHAKTFGSLIQIPEALDVGLPTLVDGLGKAIQSGDVFAQAAAQDLLPLVGQATVLAMKFDAVVANPPYMGKKSMTVLVKDFAAKKYKDGKSDTFAMFMLRCQSLCSSSGRIGLMTPFVWMFLSSYEDLRTNLIGKKSIASLVQPQYHTFFESAAVPICIFVVDNSGLESVGTYFDLTAEYGADIQPVRLLEAIHSSAVDFKYSRDCHEFGSIPGSPIAYWVESRLREAFESHTSLKDIADVRQGLATSDNGKFVRYWHEVGIDKVGFDISSREDAALSMKTWFPFNKGGAYRKWFGNFQLVVNWRNDGQDIKESIIRKYPYLNGNPDFVAKNPDFYFKAGLSWSALSSSDFSLRRQPVGYIFADKGQAMFPNINWDWREMLGVMNSKVVKLFLQALSPTLDFNVGYISKVPIAKSACDAKIVQELVTLHEIDWNSYESAWGFLTVPMISQSSKTGLLRSDYEKWESSSND